MNRDGRFKQDLSSLSREELEIRLRQCLNDLRLTREESRENALKYMEMVGELGERNLELQSIKDGLEDVLKARNAELLLAREGESQEGLHLLKEILTAPLADSLKAADGLEVRMSAACPEGLRLERPEHLPLILRYLATGLLACCGEGGAVLEAVAEGADEYEIAIRLSVSGEGVDRKRLSALLNSCKGVDGWDGLPWLLARLTGWSLSVEPRKGAFVLRKAGSNRSIPN